MLIRIAVCCSLLFGTVSIASAQTERRFGFVIGYPTVAGVQWQVTDRFALRADGGFDWGKVETVTSMAALVFDGHVMSGGRTTTTFHHASTSVGLSVLVTMARRDQLRLYLAPRVAWNRISSRFKNDDDVFGAFGSSFSTTADRAGSSATHGIGGDGMFGANYRLGDRFEVFGEAGVSFRSPTSTSSSSSAEVTSYSVGSRGDLGIVIRF